MLLPGSTPAINVVYRFVISSSVERRPGAWIPLERCHQQLRDWCAWNDFHAPSLTEFQSSLTLQGFQTGPLGKIQVVFGLGPR